MSGGCLPTYFEDCPCQYMPGTSTAGVGTHPCLQRAHGLGVELGVTGDRHSKGYFETGAGYRQTVTGLRTEDTTPHSPGHWGRLLGGRKSKLSPKDKCEVLGKDGVRTFPQED